MIVINVTIHVVGINDEKGVLYNQSNNINHFQITIQKFRGAKSFSHFLVPKSKWRRKKFQLPSSTVAVVTPMVAVNGEENETLN